MRVCPICGTTLSLTTRRCPECGSMLDRPAPTQDAAHAVSPAPLLRRAVRPMEVLEPGTVLNGRYRLARVLGTGAFGRVYLAEDTDEPNHLLAIKELLATDFPTAEEQRDATNWFKREVSTLLTLDHPGIPAIHGYWTAHRMSGPMYLAMDYVPGKTLADIQEEFDGRVPRQQVVGWGIELCDVLAYLHSRTPPFVFRDLKPANVMIHATNGRPVLIDFGLARQIIAVGGTAVGTWGYVPFEQVLGKAEGRSDLYALGAMMHSLLSGRQPDVEYRRALRSGLDLEHALRNLFPPLEPLVPGTPPALSRVIETATAFAVQDRFHDAVEMAGALRDAMTSPGGIAVLGPVESSVQVASDAVTATVQRQAVPHRYNSPIPTGARAGPLVVPQQAPGGAFHPEPQTEEADQAVPFVTAATPAAAMASPATGSAAGSDGGRIMVVPEGGKVRLPRWQPVAPNPAAPAGKPPTQCLTVSPSGAAQYTSIAAALQAAFTGARIEVHPGHYLESLVITRPVELVGVGAVEDIVIESAETSCVLMQAEAAILRGITFQLQPASGGSRFYGVNIPMGRLLLDNCQVLSTAPACVAIHGKGTNPIIRHCRLQNGLERTITVYDYARGLIEDSEIGGGAMPVRISSHANPLFRKCLIHGGRFGGVGVAEQGRGRFEECDIVENGHHGVSVRHTSYVVLSRCVISRNGWNAVSVTDNSGATVEHCDLTGNRRSTWDVKDTARPQMETVGNKEV